MIGQGWWRPEWLLFSIMALPNTVHGRGRNTGIYSYGPAMGGGLGALHYCQANTMNQLATEQLLRPCSPQGRWTRLRWRACRPAVL
ncbi:MAG: hypothetical protein KatS3mg025_0586 [Bacteroidia bacterium]|nr:MAG: hypothetical protein KatS3mg025_0586 [Bacteroidia bacterium]